MQTTFLTKAKSDRGLSCVVKMFFALCLLLPLAAFGQGATMGNPIVMGNYAAGSHTYTDSRSNSGYGNEYGQTSEDIFYSFTVQYPTQISISTCSSGFDTYLHLLNSSGGNILSWDDNGPLCSGLQSSIVIPSTQTTITSLAAGTYYIVAEGYGSNSGVINLSVNLTVQSTVVYNTRNFIRTWEATAPEKDPNTLMGRPLWDVKQSTAYLDGLGRHDQTVLKKGSLNSSIGNGPYDLVSTVEYDNYGREKRKYLPFASIYSDGEYKANVLSEQTSFYTGSSSPLTGQGESHFFSEAKFEPSPLNRVEKQLAPGKNWAGADRGVEAKYWTNTAADEVRIWNVWDNAGSFASYTTPLGDAGKYQPGKLFKNISQDEAGNQVIEFMDQEGRVILKKVQLLGTVRDDGSGLNHANWLCTYYIYDNLGQLRCVIQPEGVKTLNINGWDLNFSEGVLLSEQCFRYEYDQRGRIVMKKVPGAAAAHMVYDARDRLVMTQDGNLRDQKKWLVTVYDIFNRPVSVYSLTDITNYNNLGYHLSAAYNSTSYPNLGSYTYELVSNTVYDEYFGVPSGSGLSTTLMTDWNGYFSATSNDVWPYPQMPVQSTDIKGFVTRTATRTLGGNPDQVLEAVNIYDDKGRVIQTQSQNITGGVDVVTTQYNWAGQPLVVVQKQEKKGIGAETTIVVTKMAYDDLGRLAQIDKKLSSTLVSGGAPTDYVTLSTMDYDALGQLARKTLGSKRDPATNIYLSPRQPLEELKYSYNVRGSIVAMNQDYLKDQSSAKFGFELSYDKKTSVVDGGVSNTYTKEQYNGNIGGTIWKSAGDGEKRKYDFDYDVANRLLKADFTQKEASGWGTAAKIDFGVGGDLSSGGTIKYDDNGNLKEMWQKGWKLTGSDWIDKLQYSYFDNSNKLKTVTDGQTIAQNLGDFTDKNTAGYDYGYDKNGNLISDLNKRLNGVTGLDQTGGGAIIYNHLNLPQTILVKKDNGSDKGSIAYVYDAAGNKLQKIAKELGASVLYNNASYTTDITTTTLYIGGAVYEGKSYSDNNLNTALGYADRLQFLGHEEGRIRYTQEAIPFVYDYFVKDHLGNVRMVLTEEQKIDQGIPVAFEDGTIANEMQFYENVDVQRVPKPAVSTNEMAQLLKKDVRSVGVGKLLKVMAGDRLHVKVDYFVPTAGVDNSTADGISSVFNSLIAVLNGSTAPAVFHGQGSQVQDNLNQAGAINSFLQPQTTSAVSSNPKAYLNILFFDEQFKFVSSGSEIVQVSTRDSWDVTTLRRLGSAAKQAAKNGYAYVYVSNESKNLVYFDNFQVSHERGPILEETHYYPFGLVMTGISSRAAGNIESKQKFVSQELDEELDLNWYQFRFRNHDPQIGRFLQVDPLADQFVYNSTYAYAENRVINGVDLEGLEYYYTADGRFLGNNDPNNKEVRLASKVETLEDGRKVFHSTGKEWTVISNNHDEFRTIVGTVYVEMDKNNYTREEGAGIYDVLENRSNSAGKPVMEIIQEPGQVNGYYDNDRKIIEKFGKGYVDKKDYNSEKMNVATAGVIEGMITKNSVKDYSGGATTWHGRDLSTTPHYKSYGISFTAASHNIYGLKSNPKNFTENGITFTNKYQTTGAAGGTVFMRRTQASLQAEYKYSYPNIPKSKIKSTW